MKVPFFCHYKDVFSGIEKNATLEKIVSTLRSSGSSFVLSNTENMKTLVDSILINRLQMESSSNEVLLNCVIYEEGGQYESDVVLSATAMNVLLNELAFRGIELNFDTDGEEVRLPDGEILYALDLSQSMQAPVFLPLYSIPDQVRLMRA